MKKSPIDDPLFGRVVVRVDGRAMHADVCVQGQNPGAIEEPV